MGELFVKDPAITLEEVNEKSRSWNKKKETVKEPDKPANKKSEKPSYSHDEAVEASIRYFRGDELAARVWANKYALKDSFGHLFEKTPDDMHHRIAREIRRIEMKYKNPLPEELIYNVLKD
jgi:ribonucleoside-diphosphate reductase alpha chain